MQLMTKADDASKSKLEKLLGRAKELGLDNLVAR